MILRRAYNSPRMCYRKKFKVARSKLNTLMNKFGKYMNGSWILNMCITNQQTQRIVPRGKTLESMALRKNTDKVGRIMKLKQKNFSERNQKGSQSKKAKTKTIKQNQTRTTICRVLKYKKREYHEKLQKAERRQHVC